MYESPETEFEGLAMRFMDIRKRVYDIPELGKKAYFVAIPTTSGTGSEVTPFSVITDDTTGVKYPLADYALTPHMAIIDPQLVRRRCFCREAPRCCGRLALMAAKPPLRARRHHRLLTSWLLLSASVSFLR